MCSQASRPENGVWAEYIGGPGYTFIRYEFDLPREQVKSAKAFVVADIHSYAMEHWPWYGGLEPECWLLGGSQIKYRIFVNGRQAGLGPHRPVADQAYLHEFDLTSFLSEGKNALGVISLGERRGFAMMMKVVCEDGTERIIRTGEGWKTLPGVEVYRPVCWDHPGLDNWWKGHIGPGEPFQHIDGRRFPTGWDLPGYDDSGWSDAQTFGHAGGDYDTPDIPNLVFHETTPVRVVKLGEGHYFFDFGKEIIASLKLTLPPGGDGVEIRLGEELAAPDRARFLMRTLNCYQEMWQPADKPVTLEHFGLRAFRYGEVVGWPGEMRPESIAATVVRYPFDDEASSFESPDSVLNDVWEFCKYSVKATNVDIYQDCPTRERHAYEGDAYINMLSHYAVDSDTALARHTAEYLLHHPTWPCEWVMIMIPVFWADYMQTGDPSMLERYYEHLRDTCSFHHELDDGLRAEFPKRILVDWPHTQRDGYEFGPVNTVVNAYMYEDVKLLARMADVLNRHDEAEGLRALAGSIRAAFNARLFDEKTGLYVDHEGSKHSAFHASLFPLVFGLVPPERVEGCLRFLKGKGMTCSVYASQFFLDALYEHNEAEYALGLMTAKTGNSWGHMIYELGATISTEAWDPSQKENMSWAHPWASAPANIIPRRLFGIRPIEPGWERFSIDPQPASLAWGRIKLPTPRGPVHVSFERQGDGLKLDFTVPPGCRAVVGDEEYGEGRNSSCI